MVILQNIEKVKAVEANDSGRRRNDTVNQSDLL